LGSTLGRTGACTRASIAMTRSMIMVCTLGQTKKSTLAGGIRVSSTASGSLLQSMELSRSTVYGKMERRSAGSPSSRSPPSKAGTSKN
jgi:hypothetical protein